MRSKRLELAGRPMRVLVVDGDRLQGYPNESGPSATLFKAEVGDVMDDYVHVVGFEVAADGAVHCQEWDIYPLAG